MEFSLKACPKNKTLTTTEVEIRPTTSGNENGNFLTVKVDMICECGCEMETDQTPVWQTKLFIIDLSQFWVNSCT